MSATYQPAGLPLVCWCGSVVETGEPARRSFRADGRALMVAEDVEGLRVRQCQAPPPLAPCTRIDRVVCGRSQAVRVDSDRKTPVLGHLVATTGPGTAGVFRLLSPVVTSARPGPGFGGGPDAPGCSPGAADAATATPPGAPTAGPAAETELVLRLRADRDAPDGGPDDPGPGTLWVSLRVAQGPTLRAWTVSLPASGAAVEVRTGLPSGPGAWVLAGAAPWPVHGVDALAPRGAAPPLLLVPDRPPVPPAPGPASSRWRTDLASVVASAPAGARPDERTLALLNGLPVRDGRPEPLPGVRVELPVRVAPGAGTFDLRVAPRYPRLARVDRLTRALEAGLADAGRTVLDPARLGRVDLATFCDREAGSHPIDLLVLDVYASGPGEDPDGRGPFLHEHLLDAHDRHRAAAAGSLLRRARALRAAVGEAHDHDRDFGAFRDEFDLYTGASPLFLGACGEPAPGTPAAALAAHAAATLDNPAVVAVDRALRALDSALTAVERLEQSGRPASLLTGRERRGWAHWFHRLGRVWLFPDPDRAPRRTPAARPLPTAGELLEQVVRLLKTSADAALQSSAVLRDRVTVQVDVLVRRVALPTASAAPLARLDAWLTRLGLLEPTGAVTVAPDGALRVLRGSLVGAVAVVQLARKLPAARGEGAPWGPGGDAREGLKADDWLFYLRAGHGVVGHAADRSAARLAAAAAGNPDALQALGRVQAVRTALGRAGALMKGADVALNLKDLVGDLADGNLAGSLVATAGLAALALEGWPVVVTAVGLAALKAATRRSDGTKQLYRTLRRTEFGVFGRTADPPPEPEMSARSGSDEARREGRAAWSRTLRAWQDRLYLRGVRPGPVRPGEVWDLLLRLPWRCEHAFVRRDGRWPDAEALVVAVTPNGPDAAPSRARLRTANRDWLPPGLLLDVEVSPGRRGDTAALTLRREGTRLPRRDVLPRTRLAHPGDPSRDPRVWALSTGGEALVPGVGLNVINPLSPSEPVVVAWLAPGSDFHWHLAGLPLPEGGWFTLVLAHAAHDSFLADPRPVPPPRPHPLPLPPPAVCHAGPPPPPPDLLAPARCRADAPPLLAWLDVLAPTLPSRDVVPLATRAASGRQVVTFTTDPLYAGGDKVRFTSP